MICPGMTTKDHNGLPAMAVCRMVKSSARNEGAEAETVLMGLAELSTHYRGPIIVESDCMSLINRLKKFNTDRSLLFHFIEDIKNQATVFSSVTLSAVRHDRNRVAHDLAAWATRKVDCKIIANVREEVADLVSSDRSNL
jgi:hypothetical protein